ncbi:hypothetical protein BVZ79_00624B, partial [Haemophilus influenzae]
GSVEKELASIVNDGRTCGGTLLSDGCGGGCRCLSVRRHLWLDAGRFILYWGISWTL